MATPTAQTVTITPATVTYPIGAVVQVATLFATDGVAVDPMGVSFTYLPVASGTPVTLVYGSDAALVKDSTGNYHVNLDTTSYSGSWKWRFFSTGTGQSSAQGSFYVVPNAAVVTTTPAPTPAVYPLTTTVNQLLYSSATNIVSGLATANSGILVTSATGVPSISTTAPAMTFSGQVGVGHARTDAQIELNNAAGGHVMFSLYNKDKTEEAAIVTSGDLSNGSTVEMTANFTRFVNSVNTYNNYKTAWVVHQPDSTGDTTPLILFSNNSAIILAGNTSDAEWATALQQNTLQIGKPTRSVDTKIYGGTFVYVGTGQNLITAGLGSGLGVSIASDRSIPDHTYLSCNCGYDNSLPSSLRRTEFCGEWERIGVLLFVQF